jgi:tetratricopeptide (TPR) repeat protein
VKGALVRLDRRDVKGSYRVTTDRHGHYYYAGLPAGTFQVTASVNEMAMGTPVVVQILRDTINVVNVSAVSGPSGTGATPGVEAANRLSDEQKAAIETQMRERQALAQKNRALNDAFNAGRTALSARRFDEAVAQFNKGAELDPNQGAIWSNMAESYIGLGDTKTNAGEKQAAYDRALEAYKKAIAINPDDGALYNNYALALVRVKRIDEAQAGLQKAAELDPSSAAKYYYNLGAVLTNINQAEAAGAAFRKAIDTDPTFAEAQYQYAIYLSAKMPPPVPNGKVIAPPGMQEALEKYVALAPNGPNADSAKALLSLIASQASTTYERRRK